MNINDRLRFLRKHLRLTTRAFGASINMSGGAITNMEKGTRNITERTIRDICREYDISPEWLIHGTEPMKVGDKQIGELDIDDEANIASRLKQARKSRGFTQESLAKAINVSRGVIANIEYERTIPQPLVIHAICDVLHISEDWLKTGTRKMDYNPDQEYSVRLLSDIYNLAQQLSPEEQNYILEMIKLFKKYKNAKLSEYECPFADIPNTLGECLEKYPPLDEDGSDSNIG